jgi:hypothetical protein
VFAAEKAERAKLRDQAQALRSTPLGVLRQHLPAFRSRSEAEVMALAADLDARAASSHPLPGFWDGMGRPIHPLASPAGAPTGVGGARAAPAGPSTSVPSHGGEVAGTAEGAGRGAREDDDDGDDDDAGGPGPLGAPPSGAELETLVSDKRSALIAQAKELRAMGPAAARRQVRRAREGARGGFPF